MTKPIGVMGCLPRLPAEFPIAYAENAGNMVHASAPFLLFDSAFFIRGVDYNSLGFRNFLGFVNEKCSHLIITLANTLRLGDADGEKYRRLLDFLEKVERPIIVFGLGVQSRNFTLEDATLPQEAVNLMRFLSCKAHYLGVRGRFTKAVLEKVCGVRNAYVTGCPSLFSRPHIFRALRDNLKSMRGNPAYSGTRYFDDAENQLLISAIKRDHWLIEPVNKFNHQYHVKVLAGDDSYGDAPYFLKRHIKEADYGPSHFLRRYFLSRYKLFRNVDDWYQFNADAVSYSYGTRFHVNMATLISGKPALWVTHDARTRELVDFMNLPHVDVESPVLRDPEATLDYISYEKFFDNLGSLFAGFNEYLTANGLPDVKFDF